jgi:peptide/nickel transport system permease protein
LCAVKKNSFFDKLSLVMSVFGMSLPSFFAAILAAWIFAYLLGSITGLNMFGSLFNVDDFGNGEYLSLKNLILPAITLGIRPLAIVVELTRNSVLEVLSQDYIRTAKAKGLSNLKVIAKHALKNAMNPVVTAISGWFASLMAGAVFIEVVFNWRGIGMVIVEALEKYDFPVVMGAVLFVSVVLVFINIFVDIIYGYLDPRIKVQ